MVNVTTKCHDNLMALALVFCGSVVVIGDGINGTVCMSMSRIVIKVNLGVYHVFQNTIVTHKARFIQHC